MMKGRLSSELQRSGKIIWAVDAFEAPGPLMKQSSQFLKDLVHREAGTSVEPVYVLSPAQLNLSVEFSAPWVAQYRPAAEKALNNICEELEIPSVLPPKIIIQNFSSTTRAVTALSDYANKTGAEMIVVSSHGRSGVKRLLLGSFAESLLLASKVPVLVVGPKLRKNVEIDTVLFPTDFGENAPIVFRRTVDLARQLQARLVLFHAIPNPIEPVFQSGVYLLGGAWLPVHTYFAKETERHRKHAEVWARWARKQGVQTAVHVDSRTVSVPDSIVELAKSENAGLIAMDAHSGPVASALLGSITRQVVRSADCPVWVVRSRLLARVPKAGGIVPRAA